MTTLYDAIQNSHFFTNDEKLIIETISPLDQSQIQNHIQQLQQIINKKLYFFVPIQVTVKPLQQSKKQKPKDYILSREDLLRKMMERNPALKILVENGKFRLI